MRTRHIHSSDDLVPPHNGPFFAKATKGKHQTVLLHEAVELLSIQESDIVVDATIGGAGHLREIANALSSEGMLVGFDLDQDAIGRGRHALAESAVPHKLFLANFRDMRDALEKEGITSIDKALFDLGWSGYQLSAGRGFSFLADEPLSMTYGNDPHALTAAEIVNTWAEDSIADILLGWGEERFAKRIARAIVEKRSQSPVRTARELGEIVKGAVPAPYRYGRIHPATKSFQALRIAVNDEIGALEKGIGDAWSLLQPGGRIAVITFHSIEDRAVKHLLRGFAHGLVLTKKPLIPSREELQANPRARSAKLRVIQKTPSV